MGDQAKAVTDTNDQVKHKITVDGKEIELTLDELKEHAQKGQDYTNKTKALSDKTKLLETETKRVEGLATIVDEMEKNPKLKDALNKTYVDVKAGKISKDEGKARNLNTLDSLIEKSENADDRESWRDIRKMINEETGIGDLRSTVKLLQEEVSLLRESSKNTVTDKVETQLQKLEDELGKEFIDKYRIDVKVLAVKYPNQSARKLLFHMASDDSALETALLERAKKNEKDELERKKKGSSPGGDDTTQVKSKYVLDKAGKTTHKSIIDRINERLGKT